MTLAELYKMLISEAKLELAALREKVLVQEKLIETLEKKLCDQNEQSFEDSLSASGRIPIPKNGNVDREVLPLPTKIYLMLKEEKRAMRLTDIQKRLGKPKPAISSIATALNRRSDLFLKLKHGLYGLQELEKHEESQ